LGYALEVEPTVNQVDFLTPILERKHREVQRRKRHAGNARTGVIRVAPPVERGALALEALRRGPGAPVRVIAEIKRRSPSAGTLRERSLGDVEQLARAYVAGGASAISVLCDGPGFGGSPLDLRRAAKAVSVPLLFKEFVLEEIQIDLARNVGAHMVLLIVRALSAQRLSKMVDSCLAHGLAPVVECATLREIDNALATRASLIGVNARDLRTFQVDGEAAAEAIDRIPKDRIAIHMSGIRDAAALARISAGRADAVLIGESLMRASDPAAQLKALRGI
jgi:indole-3-glycerol phosphate synthase